MVVKYSLVICVLGTRNRGWFSMLLDAKQFHVWLHMWTSVRDSHGTCGCNGLHLAGGVVRMPTC
jgi:hypothetical protein